MARHSSHTTKRKPQSKPCGVLKVAGAGSYGFVETAEGEFFISGKDFNFAFPGDVVEVAPLVDTHKRGRANRGGGSSVRNSRNGQRINGRVVRIIERQCDTLLGTFEVADPFGVVVPQDPCITHDIFTRLTDNPSIEPGSLVKVRILQYPSRGNAATGVIEEVIGSADTPRAIVESVILQHKFETEFSAAALTEAQGLSLDVTGALARGYRDLRDVLTFTIDPVDAKDFDDALSCWEEKELLHVCVHIADVSSYVAYGSALDLNAFRRGCSVYLPDRVIPMLPERLSNDLCSLVPQEDRLCLSADMAFDAQGRLAATELFPSIIRSDFRLNYPQVQYLLENGGSEAGYPYLRALRLLDSFAQKRIALRAEKCGLDFNVPEAKVVLNDEGRAVELVLREKNRATQLVEEAMLAANECVARYLSNTDIPCVYRVHEQPVAEKLETLHEIVQEFSWYAQVDKEALLAGEARALVQILGAVQGRPEEQMISRLVVTSMQRALYRTVNVGHYGLASDCYCHFTSPIRRYPDLMVHRLLKAAWWGRPFDFDKEIAKLDAVCEHCSEAEYRADKAARDATEMKIIEYLEDFEGQDFSGVVSGVCATGLYVQLDNTAEGFIPTSALGREGFAFNPGKVTLTGVTSGKVYRLGKRIAVTIAEANGRAHKLTFELAGRSKGF